MITIRKNESTYQTPLAIKPDGMFLWVVTKESDGCLLRKTIATNPSQIAVQISLDLTDVSSMIVSSGVFLAGEHSTLLGQGVVDNQLVYDFETPVGIIESPVDILRISGYVYFLIPGNMSGTNTKIIKYTYNGTYSSIIDLSTITNASSFISDANNEIWITTYTAPVNLVRVYNLSTTPEYSVIQITD